MKVMKDKFKTNWPLKLISLLFAIALWYYVVSETNPFTTKDFRNIEVTIKNADFIERQNLEIVDPIDPKVSLKIKGNRNSVNDVKASDIEVVADFRGETGDSANIVLDYKVPDDVTVVEKSHDKINFKMDTVETKVMPIEIETLGKLPSENLTITNVEAVPEKVRIKGQSKLINKIGKVQVAVDISTLTKDEKSQEKIEIYDKNGDIMDDFTLDKTNADVNISVSHTKQVEIKPVVKNQPSGFKISNLVLNKNKVAIVGDEKVLEDISEIETEVIDLKDITNNTVIKTRLVLPKGVSLMGEEKIEAVLNLSEDVDNVPNKSYVKKIGDIGILNNEYNNGVVFSDDITEINIKVYGKKEVLDSLGVDDISLNIDIENLTKGKHELPIKVESIDGVSSITINPSKIEVTIE